MTVEAKKATATATAATRRRLWVDDSVQAMLVMRTAVYAATCVLYFCVVLFFTQWMSDAQTPMHQHLRIFALDAMYWAPGLFFIGPLVAHDLLRLTSRFSGPVHRLVSEMQTLAGGGPTQPMTLRPDDCWKELAESYNQLREELVRLRATSDRSRQRGAEDAVMVTVGDVQLAVADAHAVRPVEPIGA